MRPAAALSLLLLLAAPVRAEEATPPRLLVPLGVTYSGWKGGFADAPRRLEGFMKLGFTMVSFVPAYAYVDLDRVDLGSGPSWDELAAAVEAALKAKLEVVIKPHLDPPEYQPGFDTFGSDNHSWRARCPWRGFFDVDPMTPDYRVGIVMGTLRMLRRVFDRIGEGTVRLELGVELMNSVVAKPERWLELLGEARRERQRLRLDGKVLLSHNFTHHLEIPGDFVGRMTASQRRTLGRYVAGLDAVALSQYMDLTVAVPAAERGKRLPTASEVARALVLHERAFREEILGKALGVPARSIPPLHIGEFGIGRGGLRHPNLYDGEATPAQEQVLAAEIVRGDEGLVRYLSTNEGRTVKSAVLWVMGRYYDVFGWQSPGYGTPAAAAVIERALSASRGH
jgi:hypothetical protein